jgi:threonine/homoserine/homoserine lactone efflux protein
MDFPLLGLLQGMIIGIAISLPLGPVALIIMKRTAEFGLRAGIISSLAVVIIDTTAAVLILLSLHHAVPFLHTLPEWVQIVGAFIIFLYGLRMVHTKPVVLGESTVSWQKHFFSAIAIALTNPSTYFSFGVIGLMLTRYIHQPLFTRMEIGTGFFLGAFLWWTVLAIVAFSQRKRYMNAVNLHRIVGVIIMILAILTLIGPFSIGHASLIHFL